MLTRTFGLAASLLGVILLASGCSPAAGDSTTTTVKLPPGVISAHRICEQVLSQPGLFTDVEAVQLVLAGPSTGYASIGQDSGPGGVATLSWIVDVHAKAEHWNHREPASVRGMRSDSTTWTITLDGYSGLRDGAEGEGYSWPEPLWRLGHVISLGANCQPGSSTSLPMDGSSPMR